VAAHSYDLQALNKVTPKVEETILLTEPDQDAFVHHNLDVERQKILRSAGKTRDIKETLVIPIRQRVKIFAMLTLDNFDGVGVFTNRDILMGQRLGLVLGLGLKLKRYQEQLVESAMPVERSRAPVIQLCKRDMDILQGLCNGLPDKQIARLLGLEVSTTRNYVGRLYKKIGVHSRTQAARWALDNDLVEAQSSL
jgi:DNA-binding CsgD family transcriptional regulator